MSKYIYSEMTRDKETYLAYLPFFFLILEEQSERGGGDERERKKDMQVGY